MRRRTFAKLAGLCYLLAQFAASAFGDEPKPLAPAPVKFVRIQRDADKEPLALQTAIVRYVPADPAKGALQVDLVGAVHVGERDYYEALNKRFPEYDVVLYELVAPEGTRIPKGGRSSGHPVAMLQNGMKDMLNLEHQMQCVDYTGDNMVHADMSPDAFDKSMSSRGESWAGTLFRMMGAGIAQQSKRQAQGKSSEVDFLAALFSGDRAGAMKRFMAEQFDDVDSVMAALEGPQGSTLITERNKVALEKLKEQIAKGKKKIAIFYGAGHLADMEQRLLKDFQLKRSGEEWLTAWDLTALAAEESARGK